MSNRVLNRKWLTVCSHSFSFSSSSSYFRFFSLIVMTMRVCGFYLEIDGLIFSFLVRQLVLLFCFLLILNSTTLQIILNSKTVVTLSSLSRFLYIEVCILSPVYTKISSVKWECSITHCCLLSMRLMLEKKTQI